MEIKPAHINQVLEADDGRMVEISGDVCGVAADLKRIDPKLGVSFRFSPRGPFFAVFYRENDRTTRLVTTAQAYQGATGAWLGLDQRIVRRIEKIGSDSYDFAAEVDRQNRQAQANAEKRRAEKMEETTERALHEYRRIVGSKTRAYIPR